MFNIHAASVPSDSTLKNVSRLSYNTSPIPGNTVSNIIFSDTVPTVLEYARLNNRKTVSEGYGTLGDALTVTITIANAWNITANNVLLIDTIPNNTQFVTDSVYIDGVNITGVIPAPPTGITLNPLPGGALTTINFNVEVVTVPTLNPIKNSAVINYEYTPTGLPLITASTITNSTATTINFVSISTQKLVDKNFANVGYILTYTIPVINSGNVTAINLLITDTIANCTSYISGTIKQDGVTVIGVTSLITAILPNTGNTAAFNIILKDTLPSGTTFINNSVIINGIGHPGQNPSTGITVGTLPAGNTAVIKFSVIVNC